MKIIDRGVGFESMMCFSTSCSSMGTYSLAQILYKLEAFSSIAVRRFLSASSVPSAHLQQPVQHEAHPFGDYGRWVYRGAFFQKFFGHSEAGILHHACF